MGTLCYFHNNSLLLHNHHKTKCLALKRSCVSNTKVSFLSQTGSSEGNGGEQVSKNQKLRSDQQGEGSRKPAAPSGELYLFFSFPSLAKHLRLSAKTGKVCLTSIFVGFSAWVGDPVAMATWYILMWSCGKGGLFHFVAVEKQNMRKEVNISFLGTHPQLPNFFPLGPAS